MPRTIRGRRILTARRSPPEIPDDLLLAAAATFARQPPRAGAPADVLAAALATPLPRTRPSSPAADTPPRISDTFKLPTFWPKEPVIYFQQIEVLFDQHRVIGSVSRYRCLVLALSQEVVTPHHRFLQTITAATPNPYELLKTRLLQTYAPTDTALLTQLLAAVELGDRRPTDMMNTMLSQLPPDEPAGKLFLALYLQRLPAPLRERVAAKHFTDPQQLAEYADTLWEAQTRPLVTAAVLPAAQPPPVTSQRRGRSRGRTSSLPSLTAVPLAAGSLLTRRRPRRPRHRRPTSATTMRGLAPRPATAAHPAPGRKTPGPPAATNRSARRRPTPHFAGCHLWSGFPGGLGLHVQPTASS